MLEMYSRQKLLSETILRNFKKSINKSAENEMVREFTIYSHTGTTFKTTINFISIEYYNIKGGN